MARATPEGKVKTLVTKLLMQHNVYYTYTVTGGFGRSGVPDIIACVNGHFLAIEVKNDAAKNPPTALQQKHLKAIATAGGTSLVIDKNNIHILHGILEALT